MGTDLKRIIADRIDRWCQFLDIGSRQRFIHLITCNEGVPDRPLPNPENKSARIEWAWDMYRRRLDQVQWLDDDSLPYLDPYTGTEIFAEAFGCPVNHPVDNNPFALPIIHDARDVAHIKVPDIDIPPLAILFEIADALRQRADEGVLMRLIDIQSPMDIAALIWDKNSFYPALSETPEAVMVLASKVRQLLVAFLEEWFARYGCDFIAHYPDYYFPQGITLSEDEVGSVSAGMFETYFLPELNELSDHFGGIGMHCCANARHQWDNFKKIKGLHMLNLNQPEEILHEAHGFFADHVAQIHDWSNAWDLSRGSQQFPEHAHIVLRSTVNTRDEAVERAELFWKSFR